MLEPFTNEAFTTQSHTCFALVDQVSAVMFPTLTDRNALGLSHVTKTGAPDRPRY